jgi:hypothetical protein
MLKVLVAVIIGVAAGYHWGYGEGAGGQPSVVQRTLDRFGTSKIKAASEARDKRIDDAGKP